MMQIMRSSDHNDHEEFSLWLSEVYHQNVPWKECSNIVRPSGPAMLKAKKVVQASISAKGQRITDFSAREITLLAQDYLAQHCDELNSRSQARCRYITVLRSLALTARGVRKVTKTAPNANSANQGLVATD